MTPSTTTSKDRWSTFLRSLAPGPVALGMQSCLHPAVWHATWLAVGNRRLGVPIAQQEADDGLPTGRTER